MNLFIVKYVIKKIKNNYGLEKIIILKFIIILLQYKTALCYL